MTIQIYGQNRNLTMNHECSCCYKHTIVFVANKAFRIVIRFPCLPEGHSSFESEDQNLFG